jgi:hypothetical protein
MDDEEYKSSLYAGWIGVGDLSIDYPRGRTSAITLSIIGVWLSGCKQFTSIYLTRPEVPNSKSIIGVILELVFMFVLERMIASSYESMNVVMFLTTIETIGLFLRTTN